MRIWTQDYCSLGNNIFLTALCVMLPFVFLFWALAIKKMKGYRAIFFAWLLTILTAIIVYRMPVVTTLSAAGYGAVQGVTTICWLVFNAMFLCNLIIKSGHFEVITSSISSISGDRRIQAILIGFCFSAFLEGTASLGAPVAIAATMMTGLGFPVFPAVIVCLAGNTFSVPFGSIGLPTITTVNTAFSEVQNSLSAVTGSVGGIMSIYALLTPFLMLLVMCGGKAVMEAVPLCLAAGISYSIPNFLLTRFAGPELPSLISPLFSLAVLIIFLRFWKPKTLWRFEGDSLPAPDAAASGAGKGKISYAWTPFVIVIIFMSAWSHPAFKALSASFPLKIVNSPWPGLHGAVFQAAPIVEAQALYPAFVNFNLIASSGTALLFVSLLTTLIFRITFSGFGQVLAATFQQLKYALLTMILVFSIAQLANYSGISFTLGLALAATGSMFTVFSPLIGFIGIFLTGSVTAAGAVFGKLQRVTAEQLCLNPVITVSANMVGAIAGKLISLQSISIGAAAVGLAGREGVILGRIVKPALFLLGIGIVIILILTYVFPGYFPELE